MSKSKVAPILAVLDFETDRFKYERVPQPFVCDLYDGKIHRIFWSRDCVEQLAKYLALPDTPEYLIYAHNGGKFDFMFLLVAGILNDTVRIINSRIVKAHCGKHELRDSFAILPVPLSVYKKDIVDYELFEDGTWQKNKHTIEEYIKADCVYLHELVSAFVHRFGTRLTIASTAMAELRKRHPFVSTSQSHDDRFRPYYFGGRVECFAGGVIDGDVSVYDVNSMYPYVMKHYRHGIGSQVRLNHKTLDKKTGTLSFEDSDRPYFVKFIGSNDSALPIRTNHGLDFNTKYGEFYACSHEVKTALRYGLIEIDEVIELYSAHRTTNFTEFVDVFVSEKMQAEVDGDMVARLFAKLILNSAYGKFGQNPENFEDYLLRKKGSKFPDRDAGWMLDLDYGEFELWKRQAISTVYYDVAVAASITSAARSVLLDAMHGSMGLVYCDTDSVICTSLGAEIDPSKLGAWKVEARGTRVVVAGKKLYAVYDGNKCVKYASKGVRLTPEAISRVASGETVLWKNDAPTFSMRGDTRFMHREVKRTALVNPLI